MSYIVIYLIHISVVSFLKDDHASVCNKFVNGKISCDCCDYYQQ